MQFSVPQFIEHEAKILGPLTFKQIIIVAIFVFPCIILYFVLPFILFLFFSLILIGGGLILALGKKSGLPLTEVLLNFFFFSTKPKIYFWSKKEEVAPTEIKIYKRSKMPIAKKEEKESLPLKIGEQSRLKKLLTEIEVYKQIK